MATIFSAVSGAATVVNDRLEATITAAVTGMNEQIYTLNCSHKKHLVSSYKTNEAQPPTAPANININTVVNSDLGTFTAAFTEYARLLASAIVGQDPAVFDPSNLVLNTGKNIAFSTDVHLLGGNVHCYPVVPNPAVAGNLAYSMNNTAFNDFKKVTKFLFQPFDTEGSAPGTARSAWNNIHQAISALVGHPNQMLSQLEIAALEKRLLSEATARREIGAQKGAVNQAQQQIQGRPDLNRPPFRGTH